MGEYRVMHIGAIYQIQEKTKTGWEAVEDFANINSAKKMVSELRGGKK